MDLLPVLVFITFAFVIILTILHVLLFMKVKEIEEIVDIDHRNTEADLKRLHRKTSNLFVLDRQTSKAHRKLLEKVVILAGGPKKFSLLKGKAPKGLKDMHPSGVRGAGLTKAEKARWNRANKAKSKKKPKKKKRK